MVDDVSSDVVIGIIDELGSRAITDIND